MRSPILCKRNRGGDFDPENCSAFRAARLLQLRGKATVLHRARAIGAQDRCKPFDEEVHALSRAPRKTLNEAPMRPRQANLPSAIDLRCDVSVGKQREARFAHPPLIVACRAERGTQETLAHFVY